MNLCFSPYEDVLLIFLENPSIIRDHFGADDPVDGILAMGLGCLQQRGFSPRNHSSQRVSSRPEVRR